MSMTRTQVYLPEDLRRRIDERARLEGKTLAEVVRDALARYLGEPVEDLASALESTFGSVPDAWAPPRGEWHRT